MHVAAGSRRHDAGMRTDLSASQWEFTASGHVAGPDGVRYSRRTTKLKRRRADELIASGAPLLVYYYAGSRLDWLDGDDATAQWSAIRPRVTSGQPRRAPGAPPDWTAGHWEADTGQVVLVVVGHC
jgi:hypothetical protein